MAVKEGEKRGSYIKNDVPSTVRQKLQKQADSLTLWKEANREKAEELKALRVRLEEARASRDRWKAQAAELPASIEKIHALELALAKAHLENELHKAALLAKKKRLTE